MLKFQGLVGPYLKVTRFAHKESHALRYLKTFIAIKSFFGCIKITDSKTPPSVFASVILFQPMRWTPLLLVAWKIILRNSHKTAINEDIFASPIQKLFTPKINSTFSLGNEVVKDGNRKPFGRDRNSKVTKRETSNLIV